jgi:hypothetical protein
MVMLSRTVIGREWIGLRMGPPAGALGRVTVSVASRSAETPNTHYLFFQIITTVTGSACGSLSVRDIAEALQTNPDVVAHCIALHVHLERQTPRAVTIPLPLGYWVPEPDEIIDQVVLEPPRRYS